MLSYYTQVLVPLSFNTHRFFFFFFLRREKKKEEEMICQRRSMSLTLVPFTFCWHGHCKWEATERRLFLRDRKKTFDQKTFATVQHLPPSSFIVYCYCCSTSSPLRFHLRRKMRSVWRGKRVVAAGIWEVPILFVFLALFCSGMWYARLTVVELPLSLFFCLQLCLYWIILFSLFFSFWESAQWE